LASLDEYARFEREPIKGMKVDESKDECDSESEDKSYSGVRTRATRMVKLILKTGSTGGLGEAPV
jgi:hypothetical protein